MTKGNVYLIKEHENNIYKIGYTRGPVEDRIKQLQTGSPNKIELVTYYKCNCANLVEKYLHKRFASNRKSGEWFNLEADQVNDFISLCKQYDGIVTEMLKNNTYIEEKNGIKW